MDVTTGQRKYGGPPPNWEGPTPGTGCEVNFYVIHTYTYTHTHACTHAYTMLLHMYIFSFMYYKCNV